ncbi:MAG: iron-sulfur cluster assembly protein IscA, partial [Proteobacteria bacterium]
MRKTGCSGFAYVVNFADEAAGNDHVFEEHGVR